MRDEVKKEPEEVGSLPSSNLSVFSRGPINRCIIGLILQLIATIGSTALAIIVSYESTPVDSRFESGIALVIFLVVGMIGYLGCGDFQKKETHANQFAFAFILELVGLLFFAAGYVVHADKLPQGARTFFNSVWLYWLVAGLLLVIGHLAYLFGLKWLASHLRRPRLANQITLYVMVSILFGMLNMCSILAGVFPATANRNPGPPPEPNLVWPIIQMMSTVVLRVWFIFILMGLIQAGGKYRKARERGARP